MKIASAPQDHSAGRILAIASGKGGVGKTMLSIGMARAFSQMGERTLLMDGDLGMANIDVQLGLQPRADITTVLNGKISLADAVCPAMGGATENGGFDVISGRSGSGALANLSGPGLTKLATGVAALSLSYDRSLLDLAAGADRATIRPDPPFRTRPRQSRNPSRPARSSRCRSRNRRSPAPARAPPRRSPGHDGPPSWAEPGWWPAGCAAWRCGSSRASGR